MKLLLAIVALSLNEVGYALHSLEVQGLQVPFRLAQSCMYCFALSALVNEYVIASYKPAPSKKRRTLRRFVCADVNLPRVIVPEGNVTGMWS